jgi:hypothetical protein
MNSWLSAQARCCCWIAFVVLFLSSTASVLADGDVSVFSGKSGLNSGWKTQAWGGLTAVANTTIKREDGTQSLEVVVPSEVKPYGGLTLLANDGSAVALTEDLKKNGAVVFYLKNGKSTEVN